MSKTNTHQKVAVLKAWLDDLHSNKKKVTQPDWLKAALKENGTIKS